MQTEAEDENTVKEKIIQDLEWQKNLTEKAEEVAKILFKNYLVEHEKLHGYSQKDFFCIVNYGLYIFASDLLKLFSKASGIELDTVVDIFIKGLKLRTGTLSESQIKETCEWHIGEFSDGYNTECNDYYTTGAFECVKPFEGNGFKYCPYCSKPIEEVKDGE